MREGDDPHCERRMLGNGRRVGAMALAAAAMATALIRQRVLSRMRRVVRGAHHPGVTIHLVVGTVLSATMAHVRRARSDGGESERPGHAERKLQEQQRAESPSSRAGSHGESLHLGRRPDLGTSVVNRPARGLCAPAGRICRHQCDRAVCLHAASVSRYRTRAHRAGRSGRSYAG